MVKAEKKGVMGGEAVKGVEFSELLRGNDATKKGPDIKGRFPQVDIDPVDDPLD
jgi:hypothetical protein